MSRFVPAARLGSVFERRMPLDTSTVHMALSGYRARILGVNALYVSSAQVQLAERAGKLAGRVAKLAGRVAKLAGRVTKLAERVTKLAERVAKLAGRVAKLAGRVTKLAERVTKLAGRVTKLAGRVTKLAGRVTKLAGRVTKLAERVGKLAGRVGKLAERIAKLANPWRPHTFRIGTLSVRGRKLRHPSTMACAAVRQALAPGQGTLGVAKRSMDPRGSKGGGGAASFAFRPAGFPTRSASFRSRSVKLSGGGASVPIRSASSGGRGSPRPPCPRSRCA